MTRIGRVRKTAFALGARYFLLVGLGTASGQENEFYKLVGTWRNIDSHITIVITLDGDVLTKGGGLPGSMRRGIGGGGNFEIEGKRDDGTTVQCSYDISFLEDKTSDWGLAQEFPAGSCPKGGRFVHVDTSGQGNLTFSDGRRYDGEYRDGMPNGRGIMTQPEGTRFEGEWRNGKIVRGVELMMNGNRYDGNFRDGESNGQGFMTYPNGNRYEGEWLDNLPEGHGVLTTSQGDRYEGNFHQNRFYGHGVYTWANGASYDGEWRDDEMDGYGVYTYRNGTRCEGKWSEGRYLEPVPVTGPPRPEGAPC